MVSKYSLRIMSNYAEVPRILFCEPTKFQPHPVGSMPGPQKSKSTVSFAPAALYWVARLSAPFYNKWHKCGL